MQYKVPQVRAPASVKHANNFFPTKPFSPTKQDLIYQYYMSENPTPMSQKGKKLQKNLVPSSNMISINNGVLNQVYYIQPALQTLKNDISLGGEIVDQSCDKSGIQQRKQSKPLNSSYHTSNQASNKQISQDDQKQRSKAQNQLFQMLVNDALTKASGNSSGSQQRRNSKGQFPVTNMTTPLEKSKRGNQSLQKRLEETYQTKPLKTKNLQSFNSQTNNWYLPKKNDLSSSKNAQNKLKEINFNQTVPHKRTANNYFNHSLEGQNTAEVSFENNILQRGFQGDYSGYIQIQSDLSKNILDDAYLSGKYMKQVGSHHPKALEMLEKGKNFIRDKQLISAIDVLKGSVNYDPTLLESHYYLGIGYLGNLQYSKAISEFQSIISQDQEYRKNVYLLLAISFKKINELDQAISNLNKALQLFPRYYDALIYRGKIFIKQKQLDKAMADFKNAILNSPQKGLGYIGKADCLRYGGNYQEAIRTYQKASQCESAVSQAAQIKKAITLFEAKQYDESVINLDSILENDPTNSEVYYFKGLCKLKVNSQEALLCFEQSIKHNNSKKAVTKSLYEIAKIKIEQRDFYAAYHTLNRADFLDTEKTYLEKFRLFTEAVIFLMKRKFSESIQNFQQIQQNHSLNDFLKPLFYGYRAYGHFCLSNHSKALDDYKNLTENLGQLDQGALYNKLLCDGIISVSQGSHEKGIEYFEKAGRVYPKKMEPQFYNGVTLVNKAFHSKIKKNNQDQIQLILSGLQLIDQSQLLNEQNANVYYIRAVIKAFLQNYGDSVQDVDKAIEKSEDNIPKYFFFRALIYGCSKQYKSAVSDFSICINLDENYADAYLQRAKCEFIYGDSTQAFADLQSYISLQPDNPNIHVWAGNFLFANAAVEDAVKAYSHATDFNQNKQLLFLRAQCYMVLGQLQDCFNDVNQLLSITKNKKYEFDKECIQSLLVVFRDVQEIYFDEENEEENKDLQRRLFQTVQMLSKLVLNKSFGRLFKQHHLYIFRGVCQFHLGKYEDSLKDFQVARNQKELLMTERRLERAEQKSNHSLSDLFQSHQDNENLENEITEEEEDADLLEILEIRFNEVACLVVLKQLRKAKDKCRQLMENINEAKQEGLQHLLLALEREIRKSEGKDYSHIDQDYQRVICLYDEPKENPICFQVPIMNIGYLNNMQLRLSFSLPKVSPPSLLPTFDIKLIQDISPLQVENKPEAPWIRRNESQGDMIMFTDNLQMLDDIRLETEEEQEGQKHKSKNQLYNLNNTEEYDQPIDRNAMKKNLMLDLDIEEKLKKLLQKKEMNEK